MLHTCLSNPAVAPHPHPTPTAPHPYAQTMPKPIEFDVNGSQPLVLEGDQSEPAAPRLPPVSLNIRAAFVPPPGCVILSVDYSQVGAGAAVLWCLLQHA